MNWSPQKNVARGKKPMLKVSFLGFSFTVVLGTHVLHHFIMNTLPIKTSSRDTSIIPVFEFLWLDFRLM